ncbi:MAG: hypothetical protein RR540_05405 [Oscillospiraceae bacterium]
MEELILSYIKSATTVKSRIEALSRLIDDEADADAKKFLIRRKNLLEEERCDILDIANSLKIGKTWGEFY